VRERKAPVVGGWHSRPEDVEAARRVCDCANRGKLQDACLILSYERVGWKNCLK
jgi:hypothetical protein